MRTSVYFNNYFKKIKQISSIDLEKIEEDVFLKTASKKCVEKFSFLNPILEQILPEVNYVHKFLSFDVKLKNIFKNQTPSIAGWHCDGNIVNPLHESRPDRFLLLVSGKECLTQFISEPIELLFDSELSIPQQMKSFQEQIKKINPKKEYIEPWTLVEYSRFSFHTATKSLDNHRRLLIRINESDILKPIPQK